MGARAPSRSGRVALLASTVGLLVTLGALAVSGCEAIVGDSLPDTVLCSGDLPTSCPVGQSCQAGVCIVCPECGMFTNDAGHDAKTPVDSGHDVETVVDGGHDVKTVVDTGHDVTVPVETSTTLALGATCDSATAACGRGLFCLDTVNLTGLIFEGGGEICSATCCSDADCGESNVCYGTLGGNFCITGATASAKCGGGGCGTACCQSTSSACAGGDSCAFVVSATSNSAYPECTPFDVAQACGGDPECTGQTGAPCEADSDCENGFCTCLTFGECTCQEALDCCSAASCAGDAVCSWSSGSDANGVTFVYRGCAEPEGNGNGTHCRAPNSMDPSCAGGVCAEEDIDGTTTDVCTEPCCTDADCAVYSLVCRPLTLVDGTPPLLVCQPPPSAVN